MTRVRQVPDQVRDGADISPHSERFHRSGAGLHVHLFERGRVRGKRLRSAHSSDPSPGLSGRPLPRGEVTGRVGGYALDAPPSSRWKDAENLGAAPALSRGLLPNDEQVRDQVRDGAGCEGPFGALSPALPCLPGHRCRRKCIRTAAFIIPSASAELCRKS